MITVTTQHNSQVFPSIQEFADHYSVSLYYANKAVRLGYAPLIENGEGHITNKAGKPATRQPIKHSRVLLYVNGEEFHRTKSFSSADRFLGISKGLSYDHYTRDTPLKLKNGTEVEIDLLEWES